MDLFKVKEGTIVTQDYEEKKKIDGKMITFIPMWKYLLEKS